MKKMIFLIVILSTLGLQEVFAQTKITGTVTDKEGEVVPGASVRVKSNSDVGTITDLDGEYNLNVPEGTEFLVFSFVGMKTIEVEVLNRTVVDVSLEN